MKRVLVATHGYLANGFKSSVELLTGKQDGLQVINAYVDESDYTRYLEEFIESIGSDDEGVVFTDIFGGSVFQKVMIANPEVRGVHHITGFNLALLIEVLLTGDPLTHEKLSQMVLEARNAMQLMEPLESGVSSGIGESDDFFE